jgi:hypothetical protein
VWEARIDFSVYLYLNFPSFVLVLMLLPSSQVPFFVALSFSHSSLESLSLSLPYFRYVGGRSYFGAVARALQAARRQIFIADWRLNPDILLTRWPDPPVVLKDLLLQRASEGVEVFILVYKEVHNT